MSYRVPVKRTATSGVLLALVMVAGCDAKGGAVASTGTPDGGSQAGGGSDAEVDAGATVMAHDAGSTPDANSRDGSPSSDAASLRDGGAESDAAGHDASDASDDAAFALKCSDTSNIAALMSIASDSTQSTITPMGTHFESLVTIAPTAAQTAFLSDPTQQPAIPGSTSGLHSQAFVVTLYPFGAPSPADINQHAIGDCDGDSALASLAYLAPRFVSHVITDHHDGTFAVAMFDPTGKPMSVSLDSSFLADSGNNIAAVSGKNNVADWATVLEKAVMKYLQVFPVVSDMGGIGSEFLLPILTGAGGSFAFSPGTLTSAQFTDAVTTSLANGSFITGGFNEVLTLGSDETVTGHGYAVLVPSAGSMVSMRNPWGVSPTTGNTYDTTTDGVLNIPATSAWTSAIDLRVIAPGSACSFGDGTSSPYTPPPGAAFVREAIRIGEPHAVRPSDGARR